ncbi:MAG TPA: hypothetical protein VF069_27525 [Streptosporangiaceae bacterium]
MAPVIGLLVPGIDASAFWAGVALGFLIPWVAWMPLAAIALVRRLFSIEGGG